MGENEGTKESEKRLQSRDLFLNVDVDWKIEFTGDSMLKRRTAWCQSVDAGSIGRSSRPIPVAGSKNWLPSLVNAGHEEAIRRGHEGIEARSAEDYEDRSDAFFVVDVGCVLHKYRRWHECFPRVKPFYAIKCNANPEVVRALAALPGCGFDCASAAEMKQVLDLGVDPSRIIYANPCRSPSALEYALSAGIVTMTFDSKGELYKIRKALDARTESTSGPMESGRLQVEMVLRIRVPDKYSDCPLGEKCGAAIEECSELIALSKALRLPLVGVSFHCGSGCRDASAFSEALRVARDVFDLAARQELSLTLLDIGGGFPGWDGSEYIYREKNGVVHGTEGLGQDGEASGESVDRPLSLADIAEVTIPVLDEFFPSRSGIQVIAEPGRFFVEASHVLFTRIYAKRRLSLRAPPTTKEFQARPCGAEDSLPGGSASSLVTPTTAFFIGEGLYGCFKDRAICGVQYEPCAVRIAGRYPSQEGHQWEKAMLSQPRSSSEGADDTGNIGHSYRDIGGSSEWGEETVAAFDLHERDDPELIDDSEHDTFERLTKEKAEPDEDSVILGPSGLPEDVVARKRLPRSLGPGDWLYFSRMGAYTTSIASLASSSALHAAFFYVASTPAGKAMAKIQPVNGFSRVDCVTGSASIRVSAMGQGVEKGYHHECASIAERFAMFDGETSPLKTPGAHEHVLIVDL